MEHSDVVITQFGPFYRVTTDKTLNGLAPGLKMNPLWYVRYSKAENEYVRRIIDIRRGRNA